MDNHIDFKSNSTKYRLFKCFGTNLYLIFIFLPMEMSASIHFSDAEEYKGSGFPSTSLILKNREVGCLNVPYELIREKMGALDE